MFPPNIKKQEALLEMFMRPKMNLSKNLFFGHMNTFFNSFVFRILFTN